eukprot:scaffold1282_cov251-Pinguiococcus_pyrenoidosus.AAC.48
MEDVSHRFVLCDGGCKELFATSKVVSPRSQFARGIHSIRTSTFWKQREAEQREAEQREAEQREAEQGRAKPSQAKPSQAKPSQAKPSQSALLIHMIDLAHGRSVYRGSRYQFAFCF